MTEGLIVVCARCGKKYKLKEGFTASGFACKECGATVTVKAPKPATPTPSSSRTAAAARTRPTPTPAAARSGASRPGSAARNRRGRRGEDEEGGGEERHAARYAKKKASGALVALSLGGVAILIFAVIYVMGLEKDPPPTAPATTAAAPTDGTNAAPETPPAKPPTPPPSDPSLPVKSAAGDAAPAPTDGVADSDGKKKIGGATDAAGKKAVSRYDPPAEIPHLEDTPPELKAKIDELIGKLTDIEAGRDSLRAKEQLALIGKPAFPRVLGAMAKIRDVITDVDTMEERMLESSLRLADLTLREMDGYLNGYNKSELRPGSEKAYITYICRMHYKRWVNELSKMEKMPGPFDPSLAKDDQAPEAEPSAGKGEDD